MACKTECAPRFTDSIKRVRLKDLKPAAYNPKTRTQVKTNKMRQLIASIEEHGLIYPIAVSKDMTIIDGHRRKTACERLGWDMVPVLIIPNPDVNAVYAGVNANAELMSGLQILQVYLAEPGAVSPRTKAVLGKYEEEFGRTILRQLVKARLSWHTLATAKRIARYTEDESPEFLSKAVEYLIEHRNGRVVKSYLTLKQPADKLWDLVRKNRVLEMAFAA